MQVPSPPRSKFKILAAGVLLGLFLGFVFTMRPSGPGGPPELVVAKQNAISKILYMTTNVNYQCQKVAVFGGLDVLGSEGSWPICMDFWQGRENCEIYSFGINDDFSFDDSINKKHGCAVYSFDPTMRDKSHNRGPKLEFLQEGLYGKASNSHVAANGHVLGWKVDTLKGYMERFNTTRIDYLKIDIEYSEWSSLTTALQDGSLNNVDQIGFEVHLWTDGSDESGWPPLQIIRRWNDVYEGLAKAGFKMWYSHTNPDSTVQDFEGVGFRIPCCFELVFVKVKA